MLRCHIFTCFFSEHVAFVLFLRSTSTPLPPTHGPVSLPLYHEQCVGPKKRGVDFIILRHVNQRFIVCDDMTSEIIINCFQPLQPTITGEIETPVAVASVEFIDPREPVLVIPILRAGLALAELASSVLPATKTYHLGLRRDEETLQPSIYLNNLPDNIPEGSRVLVVDPMLATGGTIVAAIDLLIERGVTSKQIKVVSAVAAPPALQKLNNKFPGLHVYTGTIDPEVNEKGFIIPGLGDAGDRSFAT